ncbi:MAG: hypothetical protein ACI35T_01170 [Alistipes sp.]
MKRKTLIFKEGGVRLPYLSPNLAYYEMCTEAGFLNSVNGFEADDEGNVLGDVDSPSNGYGTIDNGSY